MRPTNAHDWGTSAVQLHIWRSSAAHRVCKIASRKYSWGTCTASQSPRYETQPQRNRPTFICGETKVRG